MEKLFPQDPKETLGLCLIAKDEGKNLARCIESVQSIVTEMIVVDTGSSDDTVKIAESYGAVVFYYPWDNNFSNARNFALRQAKSKWLLLLDADEQVDQDGLRTILEFIHTTTSDGAYFRVKNYLGNYEDFTLHNALRLLRNTGEYQYYGAIHEQIVCDDMQDFLSRFEILNVVLHHYGYLDQTIEEKQKRKRNMPILEQILKDNPNDFFAQYYLGNEYLALNDVTTALDYYLKSYENAKKHQMVFAHLYLRIVICMQALGSFKRALELIDEALGSYPLCTDFEFVRADIYFRTRRYTLAIKSLNRCLEMGVPPAALEFVEGCGTYRAAFMLGDIYAGMEDYEEAFKWYQTAHQYQPDYSNVLNQLGFTLNKLIQDKDHVRTKLMECFEEPSNPENIMTAADVLIKEELYDQALSVLEAIPEEEAAETKACYLKALALFYKKDFQPAIPLFEKVCSSQIILKEGQPLPPFQSELYLMTAGMILNDSALISKGLNLVDQDAHPNAQAACRLLNAVYENLPLEEFHFENGGEKELDTILSVFDILLRLEETELLNRLYGIFAVINCKSAFIQLGKRYWDLGCRNQAVKLVFSSVKELDFLDAFGAEVLFKQIIP